jgi:glycosyl-4,4'-diaponeurosporenoate acyltransferase
MAVITRLAKIKYKINLLVFILISIALTFICEKIPDRICDYKKWMFRERSWEKGGRVYERLFRVKLWKSKVPDISDFMKWRFSKKHLAKLNDKYLYTFLVESCRSEFTHWMIIFSTTLFGFWTDIPTVTITFLVACFLNLPYIIIQRYNRPRLRKLFEKNNLDEYALSAAKV